MMTPIEFNNAMTDWNDIHRTKTLEPIKEMYNVMRWQIMFLNNMNPHARRVIKNPQEVHPFPWDSKSKAQSVDELKGMLFAIARAHKGEINLKE